MDQTRDVELLGRMANGDEDAFVAIFDSHAAVVHTFCTGMLHSPDRVGEVVSDTFLSLWSEVRRGAAPNEDPGTWLISRARSGILSRIGNRKPNIGDHGFDLRSLAADVRRKARAAPSGADGPAARIAAVLGDLDYFRLKILSLAYFGGFGTSMIAERLDMTHGECILRLHEALSALPVPGGNDGIAPVAHEVGFAGYTGAHALGVLDGEPLSEFERHLADGCPACESEMQHLSRVAHTLPTLLPGVSMPDDLGEQILFSYRLVRLVGSGSTEDSGQQLEPQPVPVSRPDPPRTRRSPLAWISALLVAVIAVSGAYVSSLTGKIEDQWNIIEMQQVKTAELLLKNDHLGGISGFLEANGPVAFLTGPPTYREVSGKILLDTTAETAMLQIINLPDECAGKEIRVSAVADSNPLNLTGFRLSRGDSGRVIYRIFPVEGKNFAAADEFRVTVSEPGWGSGRTILNGVKTGRP